MTAPTGAAPATRSRPPRGVGRMLVHGIGELLITFGVVVLLFVVYELYVTDLFGERKQAEATSAVDRVWAHAESTAVAVAQAPDQMATDPRERVPRYDTTTGEGFAKLRIPVLGPDYVFTIVQGTDPDDLYIGPGHYTETQLPGEQGNFAVAGHRVSKGSPFNDLGLLGSCDAIVVETQDDWFIYRVLPMADEEATWVDTPRAHCAGVRVQTGAYAGVYGREITLPTDYAQVLPIPGVLSTAVPPDGQRLITLTTCHPQFSDTERMIIHGVLVSSYAKAPGFLPPELADS